MRIRPQGSTQIRSTKPRPHGTPIAKTKLEADFGSTSFDTRAIVLRMPLRAACFIAPILEPKPCAAQSQAASHGRKFIARANLMRSKSQFKNSPDRRNKRRSARQKHPVYVLRMNTRLRKQGRHALLYGGQFFRNPTFKLAPLDRNFERHIAVLKAKHFAFP